MTEKNDDAPRPEDVLIEALLKATGRAATAVYQFGGFTLDIAEQRLLKEGVAVSLAPKEFETLRLLVEHHGRLVTKQELLERVWSGTFVGDDTIAQRISCLRRALGGDADSPKYIETVPKRGYRFVASVTVK